ncbi:MAG TPA: hypothetical protein VK826_10105 [Bacteroidia bacterium]|nr:hypothetical protein [Bacteroidia bacterium]
MKVYKTLFIGLFVFFICVSWRQSSQSCAPKLGECTVCDSLKGMHRADALALAFRESQDSTLPYYNNIIIQEARIAMYQKCLALLYNNLEDSVLFGLRTYHPPEAEDTTAFYRVTLQIYGAKKNKWRLKNGKCGYKNMNNILTEVGLTPVGEVSKKGDFLYAEYSSTKPINKIALQRRFSAQQKPIVRVTRHLSPLHYVGMLDYKNVREVSNKDSSYILLTYPFGPGMPPELPYPVATDIYHVQGCSLSYVRTTTQRPK